MMKLYAEFRTRTVMGLTDCNHGYFADEYARDVAMVDSAVRYAKKLFGKGNYDPCLSIADNYGTLGRIFESYKDGTKGYTFILFEDGKNIENWQEKITAKDIKAFYITCADKSIEREKVA